MIVGVADVVYTYRFLKLLSTKWEDTDAFKHGIIDDNGKPLKKSKDLTTKEEKDSYTYFVRLVFKLKRLMGTIPGGKSAVARYGAAIALLKENKEEVGMAFDYLNIRLKKHIDEEVTNSVSGVEGKEQPLGKKGDISKRKKKKDDDDIKTVDGKECDEGCDEDAPRYRYIVVGNGVLRIDEKKRVMKKRVVGNKRVKKREYVPTKRKTRTGRRKLKGSAKVKWKRSHKKAYRKAHTGRAAHKRKRSMKKSRKFNRSSKKR